MQDKILKALKSYGYKAQFTSSHHAKDLNDELDATTKAKLKKTEFDIFFVNFKRNLKFLINKNKSQ